ncbi:hypothetical protein D3C71_1397560 [compost metagenome]
MRGTGKGKLPSLRKHQQSARQPVRAEDGIALHERDHPHRFRVEQETRRVDGITTDIEQTATTNIGLVAHISGVIEIIGKDCLDGSDLAEVSLGDHRARLLPLRMMAHHKGFRDRQARRFLCGRQFHRLRSIKSDRLLAEDGFALCQRLDRQGHMQVIGQRVVDCIYFRISKQILVAAIGFCDAEAGRHFLRLGGIARGDRRNVSQAAGLDGGNDRLGSDARATEHAPSYRSCHLFLLSTLRALPQGNAEDADSADCRISPPACRLPPRALRP